MIGSSQIRAARALLGMSQKEAAEGAGISNQTLSGVEGGGSDPSTDTSRKLQTFFEGCGLEFIEPDGVRKRPADREYKGESGLRAFFDDVYEVARHGGNIELWNGVPSLLVKFAGAEFYEKHRQRMTAIKERYSIRVIVKEGEDNLIGSTFAEYRHISPEMFERDHTIYIYGDRVGLFTFTEDDVSIKIVTGQKLADSIRAMFNFAWEAAR